MQVDGLEEAQAKMRQVVDDLGGDTMASGMRDATMLVTRSARQYSPVDTGRLRASIIPEVRVSGALGGRTVQGIVGSNVKYAPFMELGTRPFWPPLSALEVWARRHGTTAYLVARAIAKRGIKARKYLERAFSENVDRIQKIVGDVVTRIVTK